MSTSTLSLPDSSHLGVPDAKALLRPVVREYRAHRSVKSRTELEDQWVDTILDFVAPFTTIAAYVSIDDEPPTLRLLTAIADAGKKLLLPKLGPGLTRSWGIFRGISDLTVMAPGRPPEPTGPAFDSEILADVDVLLVPALCVSHSGERLGQGGGWYDRVLKEVPDHSIVAAMIFPEEFVEHSLPQDEMDVLIPYVILPSGVVSTRAAKSYQQES